MCSREDGLGFICEDSYDKLISGITEQFCRSRSKLCAMGGIFVVLNEEFLGSQVALGGASVIAVRVSL